jgi:lipopolysaccharide heptosyltransferase II
MEIDWTKVRRVLVVRLRSIGDTVLSTPSLIALKRFLPDAQIDVLLEDWVAPVLDGFGAVGNVISFKKDDLKSRLEIARRIRKTKYDVAFNLHGGTTGTFFVRASGARHRVGFENYQYKFLYNHRLSSASDFWQQKFTHSAEQQLALLGFVGVPVEDKPKSNLAITKEARVSTEEKLKSLQQDPELKFALFHPSAAFATKQWSTEKFALTAEFLSGKGLQVVAVTTKKEREILENLQKLSRVPVTVFDDLTLPEITVLASKAQLFVGNDSGIAHIAAAVNAPSIVIFGASNINHWRPWTKAPSEVVYSKKICNHELGAIRKGSENPNCIFCVETQEVIEAIERILPQYSPVS